MIKWIIGLLIFGGMTAGAYGMSASGAGLPGALEKPVSIRQSSADRRSGRGPIFLYFGGTRSHSRGGYRGGK